MDATRWSIRQTRREQCGEATDVLAIPSPPAARPTTSTTRAGSGSTAWTARRARTKGKIERLFRFIQQDFVLEHLEATSVAALNAAFAQWVEAYNFSHASRALEGEAPAAQYVPSLRRLTPAELELLLAHEEPRKVARTGTISYYGHHYRVPDPYIGRRVRTRLKGDQLTIQVGRSTLAEYTLDYEPRTGGPAAQRAGRLGSGQFNLEKADNLNLEQQASDGLTAVPD